ITFADGMLAVTPVLLVVKADDNSKVYGSALPDLTASYQGFVNGDFSASFTTAVRLTTVADVNSHVGTYAITPSGATDPDYIIRYVAGTLTVMPSLLT